MKTKFNYLLLLFVLGVFISCAKSSDEITPNDDTIVDSGSEDESSSSEDESDSSSEDEGSDSTSDDDEDSYTLSEMETDNLL